MMTEDNKQIVTIDHDGFVPVAIAEGSIIAGTLLKYAKETGWQAMGLPVAANLKLLVLSVDTCLQRWHEMRVLDAIFDKPLPNPASLNAQIPEDEWELDLNGGKPKPPWAKTFIAYLLDEQTCEKFTYANSTWGARLAVETLQDRVAWMRKLRGANVLPVVALSTVPMKTRFGVQPRPDFKILSWKQLGGAAPATPTPQIAGPGLSAVKSPTTAEVLNDDLPF